MDLRDLREWYRSEVGSSLLDSLEIELKPLVSCIFGFVAVQLGQLSERVDLLKNCTIHHKWSFDIHGSPDVLGDPQVLPIANDSLDLVILPHTLDFTRDAHQVLREADRVLVPEGHVIIIGFNPISFYGIWKLLSFKSRCAPWTGEFYRLSRIKDWLALLGFDVCSVSYIAHGFPLRHPLVFRRTEFIRRFLSQRMEWSGGIYICVAKKRVATLTPMLGKWKVPSALLPKGIVKPTVGMGENG